MPPLRTALKLCVAGEPVAGHSEGQSVHEQNVQTAAEIKGGLAGLEKSACGRRNGVLAFKVPDAVDLGVRLDGHATALESGMNAVGDKGG